MTYVKTTGDITDQSDPLCREFTTKTEDNPIDIRIRQKIYISQVGTDEKYYNIEYEFENINANISGYDAVFIFNADTAHAGDNNHESYSIEASPNHYDTLRFTGLYSNYNVDSIGYATGSTPDSFMISSMNNQTGYDEKIVFGTDKPDLLITPYGGELRDFENWQSANSTSVTSYLDPTESKDLKFSLAWKFNSFSYGNTQSVDFKYGIVAQEVRNPDPAPPNYQYLKVHTDVKKIWIQQGGKPPNDGMMLEFDELSNGVLGISGLHVETPEAAQRALTKIFKATEIISSVRGKLGAYQNRLEHARENLGNVIENLSHAESQIRDADVAAEMMAYTKDNILIQSAQAMLAQCNQAPQSILQLMR